MKYYRVLVDLGRGEVATHNFKTVEDANEWAKEQVNFEGWGCYPYSDINEIPLFSKYFWSWPDPYAILDETADD